MLTGPITMVMYTKAISWATAWATAVIAYMLALVTGIKKANLTGFNVEYLRLNRELNTNAKALNVWVDHSRKLSSDWSLVAKVGVSRLHNMTEKKIKQHT